MALTSPSFPFGLPPMKTEAEARSMIEVIRAGVPSTFRPGQTSLGAARDDERRLMAEFFAGLEAFRTIAETAQKRTEITAIDERLSDLLGALRDALHDAGISEAAWGEMIEEMR